MQSSPSLVAVVPTNPIVCFKRYWWYRAVAISEIHKIDGIDCVHVAFPGFSAADTQWVAVGDPERIAEFDPEVFKFDAEHAHIRLTEPPSGQPPSKKQLPPADATDIVPFPENQSRPEHVVALQGRVAAQQPHYTPAAASRQYFESVVEAASRPASAPSAEPAAAAQENAQAAEGPLPRAEVKAEPEDNAASAALATVGAAPKAAQPAEANADDELFLDPRQLQPFDAVADMGVGRSAYYADLAAQQQHPSAILEIPRVSTTTSAAAYQQHAGSRQSFPLRDRIVEYPSAPQQRAFAPRLSGSSKRKSRNPQSTIDGLAEAAAQASDALRAEDEGLRGRGRRARPPPGFHAKLMEQGTLDDGAPKGQVTFADELGSDGWGSGRSGDERGDEDDDISAGEEAGDDDRRGTKRRRGTGSHGTYPVAQGELSGRGYGGGSAGRYSGAAPLASIDMNPAQMKALLAAQQQKREELEQELQAERRRWESRYSGGLMGLIQHGGGGGGWAAPPPLSMLPPTPAEHAAQQAHYAEHVAAFRKGAASAMPVRSHSVDSRPYFRPAPPPSALPPMPQYNPAQPWNPPTHPHPGFVPRMPPQPRHFAAAGPLQQQRFPPGLYQHQQQQQRFAPPPGRPQQQQGDGNGGPDALRALAEGLSAAIASGIAERDIDVLAAKIVTEISAAQRAGQTVPIPPDMCGEHGELSIDRVRLGLRNLAASQAGGGPPPAPPAAAPPAPAMQLQSRPMPQGALPPVSACYASGDGHGRGTPQQAAEPARAGVTMSDLARAAQEMLQARAEGRNEDLLAAMRALDWERDGVGIHLSAALPNELLHAIAGYCPGGQGGQGR